MGTTIQYLYKYGNDPVTSEGLKNIYSNFLDKPVIKLGIKAPPGTMFIINDYSKFTVGPSGVFSINKPGYIITSLKFIKPIRAKRNDEETKEQINDAIEEMDVALTNFLTNSQATISLLEENGVNRVQINTEENEGIDTDSIETIIMNHLVKYGVYAQFMREFSEGYKKYGSAIKGVYTTEEGDLRNIVIDIEEQDTLGVEGGNEE